MSQPRKRATEADEQVDVVVIGCGPAGAVVASELAAAGRSVIAIERDRFPRYHVGESLTGIAGKVLAQIGLSEEMARRRFPDKPGVKVVGKDGKSEFFVPVLRPTWQVRRDEFDHMLLDHARARGADVRIGSVSEILRDGDRVTGVAYRPGPDRSAAPRRVRSRVVVDCSGHSALLSKHGIAGPRLIDAFGRQVAVFTQFRNARRDPAEMANATVILYTEKHHWAWMIPLSDDVDSVGIVVPSATYKQRGHTLEELVEWAIAELHPELTRRLAGCERIEAVRFVGNYSYRIDPFVGDGWLCVGDAHRFADPIFSFGVSFAMAEALEASRAIDRGLETGDLAGPLEDFAALSNRGQDAAFDLLRYFWRYPAFFSFLMRGEHRHDVIRLFAGDSFDEAEFPVLRQMRDSLALGPVGSIPEGDAREIAQRITRAYADFQGVEAAYLQTSDDGLLLHFVVMDEDPRVIESIHDFEESLYGDFGRDRLAVLQWCMTYPTPMPWFREAHRVYDRRPV